MAEPYSKREIDLIHKEIVEKLNTGFGGINDRLDKINGKVNRHELDINSLRNDVALALKNTSNNSGKIALLVDEHQHQKTELLESLQREVKMFREKEKKAKEKEKKFNERVIWIIVASLLFIFGVLGIVDPNYINALL